MPEENYEQNSKDNKICLRKRRREENRHNKLLAERITKKRIFEGIGGKVSPIKKVISHEIKEITDDHEGIS